MFLVNGWMWLMEWMIYIVYDIIYQLWSIKWWEKRKQRKINRKSGKMRWNENKMKWRYGLVSCTYLLQLHMCAIGFMSHYHEWWLAVVVRQLCHLSWWFTGKNVEKWKCAIFFFLNLASTWNAFEGWLKSSLKSNIMVDFSLFSQKCINVPKMRHITLNYLNSHI